MTNRGRLLAAAAIVCVGVLLGLLVALFRAAPPPEPAAHGRAAPPFEPAPSFAAEEPAREPRPTASAFATPAPALEGNAAPRALRGRVVEEPGGAPVSAATVRALEVSSTRELGVSVTTDATGRFELALPPAAGVRLYVHTGQHRPATTGELALPAAGVAGDEVLVRVRRGQRVEGRVLDAAGQPVPGAQVGVSDEGGLFVTSDQGGRFAIGGLADDPVNLFAVATGYATAHVARVRPGRTDVELRLLPPARVIGRLVDPPAAGPLDVSLCRAGAAAGGGDLCVARRRYAPAAATFTLDELPPGEYQLVLEREGHPPRRLPVRLEPGQTLELPPIDLAKP